MEEFSAMMSKERLIRCDYCLAVAHRGQDQLVSGLDSAHDFNDEINIGIVDDRITIGGEEFLWNSRTIDGEIADCDLCEN